MKALLSRILLGIALVIVAGSIALYTVIRANTQESEWFLRPARALSADELEAAKGILDKRFSSLADHFSISSWSLSISGSSVALRLRGQRNFEDALQEVGRQGLIELRMARPILPEESPASPPDGFDRLVLREEFLNLTNSREPVVRETLLWVKRTPELSCPKFKRVKYSTRGLQMETVITIEFLEAEARRFAEITAANVGQQLAVVTDGEVLVAPRIQGKVEEGVVQLVGIRMRAKARQLADFLATGALPCEFKAEKR